MSVFTPNLTSKLLVKSVLEQNLSASARVLEIGCGSGWITHQIALKLGTRFAEYHLSDISEEAIQEAQAQLLNDLPKAIYKVGAGLKPWSAERAFDVIVNDVAGIADSIAKVSPWYAGVPSYAGRDGLANTRDILSDVPGLMAKHGLYVAPVISLANANEHRRLLELAFRTVRYINRVWWPLPKEILNFPGELDLVIEEHGVEVKKKYGSVLAFTEVAICES